MGVSLVLDHPRLSGRYRGYPWSEVGVDAAARSPLRPLLNLLPGGLRRVALQCLGREVQAVAVLAGPPSVAHAEALLRGIALRGARLEAPLDTIVVPLPWEGVNQPREPLNPITAATLALGHALRLWRDAPPLSDEGTVVLLHDFSRTFGHGPRRRTEPCSSSCGKTVIPDESPRQSVLQRAMTGRLPPIGTGARRIRCCPLQTGPPASRSCRAPGV